jgi:UDP-GlcNAc:undecaprenyl-phosphate GlcNAc-1-phosphate transferase
LLALALTLLAVAPVIALARRWQLLDHPTGWKRHVLPTPLLGGVALLFGFLLSAWAFEAGSRLAAITACAIGLCIVGTIDDRRSLSATLRIVVVVLAAVLLWSAGLGWSVFASGTANLVLTVLWMLAVVNAFNLLDLMDGAAAGTAAICAAGTAAAAAVFTASAVAVLSVALFGACLGFLRHNLRRPAAIFLGDGGTMPLGLLIAAGVEAVPWKGANVATAVGAGVMLCGVPLFDLTFRVLSRLLRGDTLMTAGPDSVANWLRARLPSAYAVALALGAIQLLLCVAVVIAAELGQRELIGVEVAGAVLGAGLIVSLHTSGFGYHLLATRAATGRRAQRSGRADGIAASSGVNGSALQASAGRSSANAAYGYVPSVAQEAASRQVPRREIQARTFEGADGYRQPGVYTDNPEC